MKKSQPNPYIRSQAYRLFGQIAFDSWNCGSYHDSNHAMYVAEVVAAMAAGDDLDPGRASFLTQVALLHDVEPRHLGTPPSVFRTLDWMMVHKETLQSILSWLDRDFNIAQALIARTEQPFDTTPRYVDSVYDGHSPYSLYFRLLRELEPADRAEAFEAAQVLCFADGCANFCRDFATASRSAADMSKERRRAGLSPKGLDAVHVLQSIGSDGRWDARVAREMDLEARVLRRSALFSSLPLAMQRNLLRNLDQFSQEREAGEEARQAG